MNAEVLDKQLLVPADGLTRGTVGHAIACTNGEPKEEMLSDLMMVCRGKPRVAADFFFRRIDGIIFLLAHG